MANPARILLDRGDGVLSAEPAGDFSAGVLAQVPVSIRPDGPKQPIADHLGDFATELDTARSVPGVWTYPGNGGSLAPNQTVFTVPGGYTAGFVDVAIGSSRRPRSEFTATDGSTVVIPGYTFGANDVVTISVLKAGAVANAASRAEVDQKLNTTGDASSTILPLGTYAQGLAERAKDQARSVMDEVPPALRVAARAGTPTVDYAPYIQAILDTGRDVYLPPGRYLIRKALRKTRPGQRLIGTGTSTNNAATGTYGSTLVVDTIPTDNPTAMLTETLHSVTIGVTFDFIQPAAGTGTGPSGVVTRADLKRYPWAIDVSGAPGALLDDVGIFSAWNGIKAIGNAGGVRLGKVDIGAFNIGTTWDGPLHAVHWNHVDCWPYGFSARSDLMAIYLDGTTIGAQVGRIDEWVVDSLTLFGVRFLYAGQDRGIPGQIANLGLDGKGGLEASTGSLSVANMYATTASPNDPKLTNTGATVLIGNVQFTSAVSATTPLVINNAGRTVIQGGESITDRISNDMRVNGGVLEVSNVRFRGKGDGSAFPITMPAILQTGTGILIARANSLETPVTAASPPAFIQINADGPHRVTGNDFAGTNLSVFGQSVFSIYAGNVGVANRGRLPNGQHIGVRRTYTFDFALDANGAGQASHSIPNPKGLIRSMSASYEPGSGSPAPTGDAAPLPVQVSATLVKVNGGSTAANGFAHVIIEVAE